ncbi:MAG: SpoIID/LytB domain-containing protein [Chloroflexota bacterium]
MATILAIPQAGSPPPVAAASCTAWTSKTVPPPVIRVLRTGSGKVQTVNFRRYVAEVMASGEWPTYLRKATLEAGAVATKQYAWYYALKGNHRSGFQRNGKCYDVRDDTTDQLYRPERAQPTDKQRAAIKATWGLTLRKGGRFFLTGYRAGSTRKCAADADGWKLYAKSVEACARQGWSRDRIQKAYYKPNLTIVWAKHLGPPVRKPKIVLKSGNTVAGGAATVRWQPASSESDIASFKLQRKVGSGIWKTILVSGPKARKASVEVMLGKSNRFRVFARDPKGRRGPWAYGPKRIAAIRGPVGRTLSGASVDPAAGDPNLARITFSGRSIAYLAPNAPGLGKAKVLIGGKRVATVDLGQSPVAERKLVWTRNFARAKKRVVTVKPVDPDVRIDFDGFFILH